MKFFSCERSLSFSSKQHLDEILSFIKDSLKRSLAKRLISIGDNCSKAFNYVVKKYIYVICRLGGPYGEKL